MFGNSRQFLAELQVKTKQNDKNINLTSKLQKYKSHIRKKETQTKNPEKNKQKTQQTNKNK